MPPVDQVIINATIHTGDERQPLVRALAVSGSLVAAIGEVGDILRLAGPATRVIDAGGRLVVPGFNDAHVHLIRGAEELVGVDLRAARDEGELARKLGDHAATLPAGRWIRGGYWDHEVWPSRALPTREQIDAATPAHPVFVERLDGHMALANSLALHLAGLSDISEAPPGGTIVRDDRGRPTGLLKDNAMALVMRAIPRDARADVLSKAQAALKHAASLGVTTIQDMTAGAAELTAYQVLRERGELTARIYAIQMGDTSGLLAAGVRTGFGDDWLRIGGLKLFADGSMGSGTAAFFEPYTDDPTTRGLLMHTPEKLEEAVLAADAAGFQPVVHAIGDRANTLVLDVFEKLLAVRGKRDRRVRIEHAQVVRREDLKRFAPLGVIASVQPSHCIDDMRWAARRIGVQRCALAYGVRSFLDAGVQVAFGTDWFVEPLNPMLGLYAAVTRQFADGTPEGGWYPEERVTIAQAVACYTRGSAYAERAEDRKGALTPGKLADLVVLSHNLFTIPSRAILDTRPLLTMVGGRVVHEAWTN
jgi:predicted amidohydrolase YtcJ